MKLTKRMMKRIGLFALVFIVGALVGLFISSFQYYKHVFSKMGDMNAEMIMWRIGTLSKLRLGETEAAIAELEENLDGNIVVAAHSARELKGQDFIEKMLKNAKAYRQMYPSKSRLASRVAEELKEYPTIEIDSIKCDSALCRLIKENDEEGGTKAKD